MPRSRGFPDVIPAHGEARVLAEVKGSYGKKPKGGFMRTRYRRNSTKNKAYEAFAMNFGNGNWSYQKPNLLWNHTGGAPTTPQRLLSINPDAFALNEAQPDGWIKRLNIDLHLLAGIGQARVDGSLVTNTSGVRDDIPQPSGFADSTGYTGSMLSGTINTSTLTGPTSWAEGIPIGLGLIYETAEEASALIDLMDPWAEVNTRNKRFFWTRQYCPTVYRPERVHIAKSFPGRGVRLTTAAREIYQISLVYWGLSEMGTVIFPTVTAAVHDAKAWYREDS